MAVRIPREGALENHQVTSHGERSFLLCRRGLSNALVFRGASDE